MTAIFGSKKSRYTCPECGSDDTELVSLGAEGGFSSSEKYWTCCRAPREGADSSLWCAISAATVRQSSFNSKNSGSGADSVSPGCRGGQTDGVKDKGPFPQHA